MTTHFITTATVTPGVTLVLNDYDDLFVTPSGSLISTASGAVVASGQFARVQIDGYVGAWGTGIRLGVINGT